MKLWLKLWSLVFGLLLMAACSGPGGETQSSTTTAPPVSKSSTVTPGADNPDAVNQKGFKSAEAEGLTFQWKIQEDHMDCVLTGKTKGWVAVGFNNQPRMNGANIVIGYIENNQVAIRDSYAQGHHHEKDKIQNLTKVSGEELGGETILKFTLPLANDKEGQDLLLTPGQPYFLLLAMGNENNFKMYHAKRKALKITL